MTPYGGDPDGPPAVGPAGLEPSPHQTPRHPDNPPAGPSNDTQADSTAAHQHHVAAEKAATQGNWQRWARQDSNLRLTDYESAALTS
jgi:hypothetical protein